MNDEEKRALDRALVAKQNDAFRKFQTEGGDGQWVRTQAVDAKGNEFVAACMKAVVGYDAFDEENDPHGTRDMGFMEVMGEKVWWKIDLYDPNYEAGSPDPTSLILTRRVLTILLPSDY